MTHNLCGRFLARERLAPGVSPVPRGRRGSRDPDNSSGAVRPWSTIAARGGSLPCCWTMHCRPAGDAVRYAVVRWRSLSCFSAASGNCGTFRRCFGLLVPLDFICSITCELSCCKTLRSASAVALPANSGSGRTTPKVGWQRASRQRWHSRYLRPRARRPRTAETMLDLNQNEASRRPRGQINASDSTKFRAGVHGGAIPTARTASFRSMGSDESEILSRSPRISWRDFCLCTGLQRVRRIHRMLFSLWALCKDFTHCAHRYKGLYNEVGTWLAFRSERREASADGRSNDGWSSHGVLRLASALIHPRGPSNLFYPGEECCRRYLYETWEAGWAVSRGCLAARSNLLLWREIRPASRRQSSEELVGSSVHTAVAARSNDCPTQACQALQIVQEEIWLKRGSELRMRKGSALRPLGVRVRSEGDQIAERNILH